MVTQGRNNEVIFDAGGLHFMTLPNITVPFPERVYIDDGRTQANVAPQLHGVSMIQRGRTYHRQRVGYHHASGSV